MTYTTFEELQKINGIGGETVKDLQRVYADIEELKVALAKDKVPLRNDVVDKLKAELL